MKEIERFKPDYSGNLLYPVFFRLDKIRILVVGGGVVGTEKIFSIFKNSPNAHVTVLAPEIRDEILKIKSTGVDLQLNQKFFEKDDVKNFNLIIAATANPILNQEIWKAAKESGILCNVADTPELCDFYLGSIVKKGDLKFGISTNGMSPTLSKRLREFFEYILPDSLGELIKRLNHYREKIKGDFEQKIKEMDKLTEPLINK